MRALVLVALLGLAACSTQYERSALQSGGERCRVSNLVLGHKLCRNADRPPDPPLYCYKTLAAVECFLEPKPNLSAETDPTRSYPPLLTDPSPTVTR